LGASAAPQLLLSAPTKHLAARHAAFVVRAIRLLASWAADPEMALVAGGGAFEARAAAALSALPLHADVAGIGQGRDKGDAPGGAMFAVACRVLAAGFAAPALQLAENGSGATAAPRSQRPAGERRRLGPAALRLRARLRRPQTLEEAFRPMSAGEESGPAPAGAPGAGSNARARSTSAGPVEPLRAKLAGARHVAELLRGALRIESVIEARKA
jgi:chaperonin GroEL (HSP60 family)